MLVLRLTDSVYWSNMCRYCKLHGCASRYGLGVFSSVLVPEQIQEYSSRGPTTDGRIKPDVVGVDGSYSATFEGPFEGTSQASPHVAGLAALVRERFPNLGPVEVRST